MRAVVIGHGSIGARHARILTEIGCDVSVVTSRPQSVSNAFPTIEYALQASEPDYVVIANKTSEHRPTIEFLAKSGFRGRVLIEKPLFDSCLPLPPNQFSSFKVAYNLRFNPALRELKEMLLEEDVISLSVHAGQFLPDWRRDRDYKQSYSAKRSEGGGVLRDLSHELDYLLWLFGPWSGLSAMGGHKSNLQIDSDDIFVLLLQMKRCSIATIELNYLDRVARREILINTQKCTLNLDLIQNTFTRDGGAPRIWPVERDLTYRLQHLAMIEGDDSVLCTPAEAMQVLELIEAAEHASGHQEWITKC